MNKIEVDPKLFITCRLCLDEMGQYQIVPQVQMQIKYCFDIEVESFDGLPQLICKKCESILSQYAGIKQIFQEKQHSLKLKMKENDKGVATNGTQQQITVNSSHQVDSDTNSLINNNKKQDPPKPLSSRSSSVDTESCKDIDNRLSTNKKVHKGTKRFMSYWKHDYIKYFVCNFCGKFWKDKRSVNKHLKECNLIRKYSNVLRRCIVKMNKVGSTTNFTYSNENVVYSRDKVIYCKNKNYYVFFTPKLTEKRLNSDSSDEDFIMAKKMQKRRRLLSKSSNDTLVIEENNVSNNSLHSDLEEAKQNNNQGKLSEESDIEFVNIDDSDSASTTSHLKNTIDNIEATENETYLKPIIVNDKVIQNIIAMCYNKYLKRLEMTGRNSNDLGNTDSFLQRKILSIGRKVVHDKGLNSTGLIRYMEHKDLDVLWIQKNQANVCIKTTLREDKTNDKNIHTWRNLKTLDKQYESKDFIDIFEETASQKNNSSKSDDVSNVETQFIETRNVSKINNTVKQNSNNVQGSYQLICFDDNIVTPSKSVPNQNNLYDRKVEKSVLYLNTTTSETENQNMLSKLLNANPVPNPRQLPKKSTPIELLSLLTNPSGFPNMKTFPNNQASGFDNNVNKNDEELTMPIITSTVSLANNIHNDSENNHHSTNKPEILGTKTQFPRIKVKPVSELMPEKTFNQPKSAVQPTNNWSNNSYNENQNVLIQNENTPVVFMKNGVASCSNVNTQQLETVNHSQYNMNQSFNMPVAPSSNMSFQKPVTQKPSNQQYVKMHTVELPNKKTNSPFRYFQELLQIHNIVLLDSTDIVTSPMSCLIKFKLVFQQESTAEVTLCLSLFYNRNTFCIRVKDIESKHLAIAKLPPYWQWEILKEFKGNIVPKLYENANKIGPDVLNKTTYFVSLLGSIVFSKQL